MSKLITDNLATWSAALTAKSSGAGRGSNKGAYGIQKLRELILELAVRGQLVPQDPADEPASELLKKIRAEKDKLIKAGKIRKDKPLPEITEEEKPFALPEGWEWVRLGEVGITATGGTPATGNSEYFGGTLEFVGPGQINELGQILNAEKTLTDLARSETTIAISGDILMVCIGGSIGKAAIANREMAFNQQINSIRVLKADNQFIYLAMATPQFLKAVLSASSGSATPIINRTKWSEIIIPIPPLPEQHRIVAKVDELMALCEKLEDEQANSAATHEQLVNTLLDGFIARDGVYAGNAGAISGGEGDNFTATWTTISQHFDLLFTTPASIDKLKQTLLQLAVMGKLVPQDPADEPASELLKKIRAEKDKLIKAGKIKKDKPLPEITEEENPFELPKGWEWVRLGDLISLISGQHLKPDEYTDKEVKNSVPYITGPAEFGLEFPTYSKFTTEMRALANRGDILITCKGSGIGKINTSNMTMAISRQLMAIQPILINISYTKLFIDSKYDYFQSKGIGIAIPGISREDILELLFALPPLSEQHRIVAKVDELMALCDQLKARLEVAAEQQRLLADVMVQGAVG